MERLFKEGLTSKRDRALFAICLFTGCRISEALALETTDVKNQTITFRKSTTKGKLKTRQVSINPAFGEILQPYQERVELRTRVLYRPPFYRTGLIFGNTATRNELTNQEAWGLEEMLGNREEWENDLSYAIFGEFMQAN